MIAAGSSSSPYRFPPLLAESPGGRPTIARRQFAPFMVVGPPVLRRHELGDIAQEIGSGGAAAGTALSIAGGIAGEGSLLATSIIPIVGPIIAGVTLGLQLIFSRKGPRQKEIASQDADRIELLLKKNLEGYLAGPHYASARAAALKNFDDAWAWLVSPSGCGNPDLGDPGRRCISERQAGGSAPWCPTGTGCDWFTLYRNPIAQDPKVQPDPLPDQVASVFGPDLAATFSQPAVKIGLLAAGLLLAYALTESL